MFVSVVSNPETGDVGLIVRTIDGSWSDRLKIDSSSHKLDPETVLDLAKQVVPQPLEVAKLALVEHSSQQVRGCQDIL